jgi:hypothetical protein
MAEEPTIWIVLRHSEPCSIEGVFQSEEDALDFARQEVLKECTCDEICCCDMKRDSISTLESSLFVTSSPTMTIGKFLVFQKKVWDSSQKRRRVDVASEDADDKEKHGEEEEKENDDREEWWGDGVCCVCGEPSGFSQACGPCVRNGPLFEFAGYVRRSDLTKEQLEVVEEAEPKIIK